MPEHRIDVQCLRDRAAIHDVLARYFQGVDAGEPEQVRNCFAEDVHASYDGRSPVRGIKALTGMIAAMIATIACSIGSAVGQSYPSKPIRLLVAYPPGGSTDINARIIAPKVGDTLGQQVIIDNRTGASGMIATSILANSAPDGHTLMMVDTAHAANPAVYKKIPYDTLRDFSAVTLVTRIPMALLVNPTMPAKSVKDLVALAKARPGAFNYASAGTGTPMFLVAELFKSATNTDIVHIAYKGGGPALAEVMGGQVPIVFSSVAASMPLAKTGRLRALGVTSLQRSATYPELPTVAESGVAGFEFYLWQATIAPAGVPHAVIARLNKDIIAALNSADVNARLSELGNELIGNSPEQANQFIRSEVELWRKIIKPEMRIEQ